MSVTAPPVRPGLSPNIQGRPIPNVGSPSLSADGRFVAFSNVYTQRGPIMPVWLRDRSKHHTPRVSVGRRNHPADDS